LAAIDEFDQESEPAREKFDLNAELRKNQKIDAHMMDLGITRPDYPDLATSQSVKEGDRDEQEHGPL